MLARKPFSSEKIEGAPSGAAKKSKGGFFAMAYMEVRL
jgi:hypothetical protein